MGVLNYQIGVTGLIPNSPASGGQSLPTVIYLFTNDTLATVTTAGYLNESKNAYQIPYNNYQMALVYTTDQGDVWLRVTVSGTTYTLMSPTATGTVNSVLGTANRITSSGGSNPVINISAAYVGQASITTVGNLVNGSLAAGFTPVTVPLGGTNKTSFTAFQPICGGTITTAALQSVATGTVNYVLTYVADNALPTWQAVGSGGTAVTSLAGTANQINASAATGAVTLTLSSTIVTPGSLTVNHPFTQTNGIANIATDGSDFAVNIGTAASSGRPITIGNATGTTTLNLTAGSGGIVTTGVAGVTVSSAAFVTIDTATGQLGSSAESGFVDSITGTANEITASASTGAVTLSVPSTFIAPGSIASTTTLANSDLILNTNKIESLGTNENIVLQPNGSGIVAMSNAQVASLTASEAVFTDGSKNLVSNAITGTGNVVMSSSPTLVTPTLGAATATTLKLTNASGILDTNGNSIIALNPQSNAVNHLLVTNNATGNPVYLQAYGSDTNIGFRLVGTGNLGVSIGGTSAADNAAAGYVGEFVSSVIGSGSPVTLTNTTVTNITSISLTAGDWDVWGNITWLTLAASVFNIVAWVSTTSATLPDVSLVSFVSGASGVTFGAYYGISAPMQRINVSSTTTVYLSGYSTGTTGSSTACGGIYARRIR